MRKTLTILWVVAIVAALVLSLWSSVSGARRDRQTSEALWARATAGQTVMPDKYIFVDLRREVRIRNMPRGSCGWASERAIVVAEDGRCFLSLEERVELSVKPDSPAVELRCLEDGTFKATVLGENIRWEPSEITGLESDGFGARLYFPVSVEFSDSPRADTH